METALSLRISTDHAPLVENLLLVEPVEQTCLVEDIEGDIPEFVRGTYYLNGPAGFARPNFDYSHWLDGDGIVSSTARCTSSADSSGQQNSLKRRQPAGLFLEPSARAFRKIVCGWESAWS